MHLVGALKEESEMLAMFVFVCTDNEDTITTHEVEDKTTNHLFNEPLKCLSYTPQAKSYAKEFP